MFATLVDFFPTRDRISSAADMNKMLIRLAALLTLLAMGCLLLVATFLWTNNRRAEDPTRDALNASRERAIEWLARNDHQAQGSLNFAAWKRIGDSNDLLFDSRLENLLERHRQNLDRYPIARPYAPFFDEQSRVPQALYDDPNFKISDLDWFYLGALSCDRKILERSGAFLQPAYCGSPFLHLLCPTHQLTGFIYMEERSCDAMGDVSSLVTNLQGQLKQQLRYLPVSGRTYLERILALIESGATDSVKPIWIHNALERQEPDGGWGEFYGIVPMGNGTLLGFPITLQPVIWQPESTFTPTAVGLSLVTQMLTMQRDDARW